MNLLQRVFGKEKVVNSFYEKDNMGTRHDSVELANGYWMARNMSRKLEPYVLYVFEKEMDALKALLELPCIHQAQDSGKLICTESLVYGCYRREDGKHEAVVCGNELTYELWEKAKASFGRHNGKRRNDQAPEKHVEPQKKTESKAGNVMFVREDRQSKMGETFIYRIYKAPNAASAKAFLEQNPVTKELYYLIIETPEGNYCRDIQGIYKE